MNLPKLGPDPADYLSKPISSKPTKLSTLFQIPIRRNPKKPGRELTVVWDKRLPLVDGFENNYSYLVSFTEIGNCAGNHYHHHKQELFTPAIGKVKVILENIETKERETITLDIGQVLYIPPNIAHTTVSNSTKAVLYVAATYPNNEEDEFPYDLSK